MDTAQRKNRVLGSIVELYIRTGEPVGSKAVSDRLNGVCSTATIRNDMCELIERGLLIQPHTSAGRVPSAGGFRYYIDHLMPTYVLDDATKYQIDRFLPQFKGDPERYILETAKSIARVTGCTALITTPTDENATLKRLELLPMSDSAVLIVILTSGGIMKSKICRLDIRITTQELEYFSTVLNERFSNLKLEHITPAMSQTLAVSLGVHTLKFAPLLEMVFGAVEEAIRPTLHLEGQANLLLYKEFSPVSVIELFARRDSLIELIQQTRHQRVYLGHELGDNALQQASLIVNEYQLGNHLKGKMAILGPLKADYYRMIPVLSYIAEQTHKNISTYI